MVFCRVINTEPLVVVNTGLGDVQMALEELEYANGPADSPMGRLRAKNGHPEPYGVRYWGIGNEMYGNWQLGHMPLEQYVEKHNAFVRAMREKDPHIKVVAVGNVGPWTEGMFRHCADFIDLMSEHFYVGAKKDLIEHVNQAAAQVRRIADAHRRYRRDILGGREIPVALDEWNYWYGEHVFGELGTRYFVRDGLGIAKALNEFARNTDVYAMANYAQTVNVIGAIKTTKTAAAFETTGLMLVLYRRYFGQIPVATASQNPLLDAQAALLKDNKTLAVAIVNPTGEKQLCTLRVAGATVGGSGKVWTWPEMTRWITTTRVNPLVLSCAVAARFPMRIRSSRTVQRDNRSVSHCPGWKLIQPATALLCPIREPRNKVPLGNLAIETIPGEGVGSRLCLKAEISNSLSESSLSLWERVGVRANDSRSRTRKPAAI